MESGTLPERVANWIRTEIVEGRLGPGERIRQEAVAQHLNTSRMPVREALKRLHDEGLVTHVSHVGARVAALDLAELDEIYRVLSFVAVGLLLLTGAYAYQRVRSAERNT